MPTSELIIGGLLILNVIVDIALAVLIFVRAYRQPYARFFFAVLLCAAGWTIGDLLALYSSSPTIQALGRYAFYIVPMGVPPCLWFFSLIFPEGSKLRRRTLITGSAFAVACSLLVLRYIDKVGQLHTARPMNVLTPAQPGFMLYGLYLSVFFTLTYIVLYRKMRHTSGIARTQVAYTFYGVLIGSCLALVSNVSLPVAGIPQFIWLGPVFTLMGVSLIALAIVRYRLFDIRFFVVRAAAYLTTLFLITFIFIAPFALVMTYILGSKLDTEQIVFVVVASVSMLYFLQYLRKFFDKITARIFFRHEYDPQTFLDQLNQALVNNIELEKLLKTSAQIIADNLRAEFCLFGIKETGFKGVRVIGTTQKEFNIHDILEARHTTPHIGTNVVIADYLPPEMNGFKQLMAKNNVAALARLVPEYASTKNGVEGLGYIVLGQKRSGKLYSLQDTRILGIIANELVIAIQNALRFEEIQRFNVTLQEEVDNATSKLRRTNRKLEELDNIKDDFISMASHQLRTPLTTVKGYLSMVLEGDAGKLTDQQTGMLQQAYASSQRMVFLITDLLNVSRLKTGKFIMNPAPTDLGEIIQEEITQLQETARVKGLELSYDRPANFPQLMLDEVKIRQVIMNFVDNAIYYTPDGGHIRVELEDKPSTIELHVVDDGIGVPKAEQHHLFTKFYRATNARKTRPDGTGLGLFMAEKVIVASGGSTIYTSKEGQGSTFGFVFSKNKLAVPAKLLEKPKI